MSDSDGSEGEQSSTVFHKDDFGRIVLEAYNAGIERGVKMAGGRDDD